MSRTVSTTSHQTFRRRRRGSCSTCRAMPCCSVVPRDCIPTSASMPRYACSPGNRPGTSRWSGQGPDEARLRQLADELKVSDQAASDRRNSAAAGRGISRQPRRLCIPLACRDLWSGCRRGGECRHSFRRDGSARFARGAVVRRKAGGPFCRRIGQCEIGGGRFNNSRRRDSARASCGKMPRA